MGDVGYSRNNRAAVEFCQNLDFSTSSQQCYAQIRDNFYSKEALSICAQNNFDSQKIACLNTIANGYFQPNALRVCRNFDFGNQACMQTIKNKVYADYETSACTTQMFDSGKVSCLQTFGRTLDWQSRRAQPPVIVVEPTRPVRPVAPVVAGCDVHNSSSYIETIAERNFEAYAKATARESRSCVVASTISETRSRMLINEYGQVVARNLTERETNEYKRAYGYDRCKVLVCR